MRSVVVLVFLSEEMDQALKTTLGVLDSCGFKTRVVEERELRRFSTQTTILIGKHPKRKHNGGNSHRRRFTFYQYRGFWFIGYVGGADSEIDNLWWRDLFCKLHRLIWDEIESERLHLIIPLARLKELGN